MEQEMVQKILDSEARKGKVTNEDARRIAQIIKEDLELVRFPTGDPVERRGICLKLAIETKGVAFSLKNDGTASESAQQVIDAAKLYQAYMEGL